MSDTRPPITHTIYSREQIEVNTDPQWRCYYGCHARSEMRWTEWRPLYDLRGQEAVDESLASWRELAKSAGPRVLEYKAAPIGEKP